MQIVHRDISLENVLQATGKDGNPEIRIIDFGMATIGRKFRKCARGKASYQAPEMRASKEYDAFLSDEFAAGVVVYSLLTMDYPWLSTEPGKCKRFGYVLDHGLRAYCEKQCVRSTKDRVIDRMSRPLMQLLEGMLSFDPDSRLTLGEQQWVDRRSVWEEMWMNGAKDDAGKKKKQKEPTSPSPLKAVLSAKVLKGVERRSQARAAATLASESLAVDERVEARAEASAEASGCRAAAKVMSTEQASRQVCRY
jgi:serine/threonine protein kinase